MKKFNKSDFYDIYVISLVMDKLSREDKKTLSYYVDEIAKKLINITKFACCAELRYAKLGGQIDFNNPYYNFDYDKNRIKNNQKVLSKYNIKNPRIRKYKEKLSLDRIQKIFNNIEWIDGYGSDAWANIAKSAHELQNMLPTTVNKFNDIIIKLDHLVDLEHNNDLFLRQYCTFDLFLAMDDKFSFDDDDTNLLQHSSEHVKEICSAYYALV